MSYMIRVIFLVITLIPVLASAETYLCLADAVAGVNRDSDNSVEASVYDTSKAKFITSNESGKWLVKKHGNDFPLFDTCDEMGIHCENSTGFAGRFMRLKGGIFDVIWLTGSKDGSQSTLLVGKGHCTKL